MTVLNFSKSCCRSGSLFSWVHFEPMRLDLRKERWEASFEHPESEGHNNTHIKLGTYAMRSVESN